MELKTEVGFKAGEVWQLLNSQGPLTIAQLKKKFNGNGELFNFAIGWLAREDKIDFSRENKTLRVQLK